MLRFHIGCLPDPHLAMPHAFFNPLQCLERAGREGRTQNRTIASKQDEKNNKVSASGRKRDRHGLV